MTDLVSSAGFDGLAVSDGLSSVLWGGTLGPKSMGTGFDGIVDSIGAVCVSAGAVWLSTGALKTGAESQQQLDDSITGEATTGAEITGADSQHAEVETLGVDASQHGVSTTQQFVLDRFKKRSKPRPAQAGLNVINTVSEATVVQRTQNRKLFDMEPSPPVSRAQSESVK